MLYFCWLELSGWFFFFRVWYFRRFVEGVGFRVLRVFGCIAWRFDYRVWGLGRWRLCGGCKFRVEGGVRYVVYILGF